MNIIVSGGGIAGSAAALFLARKGHQVRVIDRAPSFQKRGYGITLKSFGLKLMTELGLDDELAARSLDLHELRLYDDSDRFVQAYSREVTDQVTHGLVVLYRSELHAALHEAASRASMETRFGVHIEAVKQSVERVEVKLSDGTTLEADLLVVAEGVRSGTRKLLWGDDGVHPFDVVYAAGTVHVDHGLDPRAIHGYMGEGQNVALMPVGEHDLLIQCYWRAGSKVAASATHSPTSGARARLREAFANFAPSVRRLLDAIPEDGDVFSDSISMIDLPSLHRGRTVLLGDAGYCPTFLSGMGASLGLLGAKVLSEALPQAGDDVACGLEQYDATMRPVVKHFQGNARANVDHALPVGHLKNVLQRWLVHLVPPALFAHHFRHQFDIEDKLLHGVFQPAPRGHDGHASPPLVHAPPTHVST